MPAAITVSKHAWTRFLATFLIGAAACGDKRQNDRRSDPKVATVVEARVFRLVTVDGEAIPHQFIGDGDDCDELIKGGTYVIDGSKWQAVDDIERKCPEQLAFRVSLPTRWQGTVRKSGDTLTFFSSHEKAGELTMDRGVVRGDSLFTRGEDFGPARVYVRQSRGPSR